MIYLKQILPRQQDMLVEKYKPKSIKGFNWLISIAKKLLFTQITETNTFYEQVDIDESELKEFIYESIKDINCDFNDIDYLIVGRPQFEQLIVEFQLDSIFRTSERIDEYAMYGYRVVVNPYISGVVPVLKTKKSF